MTALLALFLLFAPADRPGYFGFTFTMHSDASSQWLVVRDVAAGSPAARAGLAAMDVITAVDGKPLHFRNDLEFLESLSRIHAGQRLRLGVLHGQKKKTIVIQAGTMSDEAYERWQLNLEMAKRRRPAGG